MHYLAVGKSHVARAVSVNAQNYIYRAVYRDFTFRHYVLIPVVVVILAFVVCFTSFSK